MTRSIVSPERQSTTFVELFFDLVFVFCITQVAGLLHADLSWIGVGRSILVFWLVWWAWTQFTWALNAADATHPFVELGTLVATAIAFFMAVAIPDAFSGRALWFALTYVFVRSLGLWIYAQVARSNPGQHAGVRLFSLFSTGGLAAVLAGGLAGAAAQPWLWGVAIGLDVMAALVAGRATQWGIHADHFAERHGLIVIIALGESLIIAAAGLAEADFVGDIVGVAFLGVLISCAFWWTYFPVAKPELERALASAPAAAQGAMARDVFSLAHFPMLCGIVAYAVALEEAIAHPGDPLAGPARLALAAAALTAGTVVSLGSSRASAAFAAALAGVVLVAVLDEQRADRLSHGPHEEAQ